MRAVIESAFSGNLVSIRIDGHEPLPRDAGADSVAYAPILHR